MSESVHNAAEHLAKYEKMQCAIQKGYDDTMQELAKLKSEGKEKTAAFRSLFAKKLLYKQMLTMYELHGM